MSQAGRPAPGARQRPAAAGAGSTLRLDFRLAADDEDRLTAELWSRGTLGTRSRRRAAGRLALEAWFAGEAARRAADTDATVWRAAGAELLATRWEAARDWLRLYRSRQRPFAVGRGLWIDPGEPDPEAGAEAAAPSGRRLLRLPARQAFGIGSHESTALALELLEGLDVAGSRVLDVGCGTGILAFAAVLGGAARVVAVDVDPAAVFAAAENRRLNRLELPLVAGRLDALGAATGFDLALVNVLPARIRPDLPRLARRVRGGGGAIFSGILNEGAAAAEAELAGHGFSAVDARRAGGWTALLTRREPA